MNQPGFAHEAEHIARIMMTESFINMEQFFYQYKSKTAIQRYEALMEYDPVLVNRVPLGMLASYLNMSQETLSRLRSKR